MDTRQTKKIVIDGLMIAIVFLTTYFTKIPGITPQGYVNFGDISIIIAALIFGKRNAFVAGSIGSALADLSAGFILYIPITFVVKGIEGFIIALIAEKMGNTKIAKLIAIIVGMVIMISGYFIAESTILTIFDKEFGYIVAVSNLPGNIVQGVVSAVIGYGLSFILSKNKVAIF